MKSKNLFGGLVKELNGIGFYNPKMKIYSLKEDGNACKKVFDYLCKEIPVNEKERFIRINRETIAIIKEKEIRRLEKSGYTKL